MSRRVTADVVLGRRNMTVCSADAPSMYRPNAASIASAYAGPARVGPASTASAASLALTMAGPMPSPCRGFINPAASPASSTLPAAGGVPVPPMRSQPPMTGPGRASPPRSPCWPSIATSRARSPRNGACLRLFPRPTPMPTFAWPFSPGNSQPYPG
ncbi:MAG TPA: hypothetical protein VGS06_27665 [Streptosporangiaceae bacterium]|nr:hypothetical protein [Streptosporangiaceae bacterium]